MYVIDSQVHIWGRNTEERPWPPGGRPHRLEPFSAEELLVEMDRAAINRAVLVPPSWEGNRNDLALAAASSYPERFAVMGRLVLDGDSRHTGIPAGWLAQAGMLGIRLNFGRVTRHQLIDGTADWVWSAAEEAGIPIMVYAPGATSRLEKIAVEHPQLRLVVDHLGLPVDASGRDVMPVVEDLIRLAGHANVAVKASALPCHADDPYPFQTLHEPICRLVAAFGAQRVFWGTDFTRLPCSYRQAVSLFAEEVSCFSDADLEWIMGRGVAQWLGWEIPDAPWAKQAREHPGSFGSGAYQR